MSLRNVIKYIVGIVFLVSAVLKLIDYSLTVEYFANIFGLESVPVKILLSLLIILEIVVSYLIMTDYLKNKFVFLSVFGIIMAFIIVNLFFLLNGYSNCGCFGKSVSSSPTAAIFKNIIMLFLLYYLKRANKINEQS